MFFRFVWSFFIFLCLYKLLTAFVRSLLNLLSVFMIIGILEFSLVLFLIPVLFFFPEVLSYVEQILLFILFNSLCLFLCLGRFVMFLGLGEVTLCWRHPVEPSNLPPSGHRIILADPLCERRPFYCVSANCCSMLVGRADSCPGYLQALLCVLTSGLLPGIVEFQY